MTKYKTEIGKDFKRIVFYLCEEQEFNFFDNSDPNTSADDINKLVNTKSWNSLDCDFDDEIFKADEMLAIQLGAEYNTCEINEDESKQETTPLVNPIVTQNSACTAIGKMTAPDTNSISKYSHFSSHKDIIKFLSSKINHSNQFFLVMRRGTEFSRVLNLSQRQTLKSSETNILRVHYRGEDGIDSGAMVLEFLYHSMKDMARIMFPDGAPVESSYHLQKGNFRSCGEIAAVSMALGGPAPCFLKKCSFVAAYEDIDMLAIKDELLTERELKLLDEIRSDCTLHSDVIIDNGYTGPINKDHTEDIVRSLKVNFVCHRKLYMDEFMKGLDIFGLADIIRCVPEVCKKLFVVGEMKDM